VAASVVDDVFGDLIRVHPRVVLAGQGADLSQFVAREDLAARIGRRADDDAARLRRERRAQRIEVDRPVGRIERDELRLHAEMRSVLRWYP